VDTADVFGGVWLEGHPRDVLVTKWASSGCEAVDQTRVAPANRSRAPRTVYPNARSDAQLAAARSKDELEETVARTPEIGGRAWPWRGFMT